MAKNLMLAILLLLFVGQPASAEIERVERDQLQQLYEADGHLYTTFIVARLAGMSLERAIEFCWGSQVPDENTWFTAVWAAIPTIFGSKYHENLMTVLHSLHGGDAPAVYKRRADLRGLISRGIKQKTLPDWQAGLMIHAYADSYAHTLVEGGLLRAYGYPFGHGFKGHAPDVIAKDKPKYLEYAAGLYFCFKGEEAAGQLKPLEDIVASISTNRSIALRTMQELALKYGLTSALDEAAKKRLVATITTNEVEKTMALMKATF